MDYLREVGFKNDYENSNIKYTLGDKFEGHYKGRQVSDQVHSMFSEGYAKICYTFKTL